MSEAYRSRRRKVAAHTRLALVQTLLMLSLAILQKKLYASANPMNHPTDYNTVHDSIHSDSNKAGENKKEKFPTNSELSETDGVLIMNAIDGSVAGLSKATGELLWRRSGNPPAHDSLQARTKVAETALTEPLLSTTTTVRTPVNDWRTAAVPSMDGSVYLTASTSNEDVTLATTVSELVSRAPFVDKRGRWYTGSRQSNIIALDADSGEIVHQVQAESATNDDLSSDPNWMDRKIVWIGRVDHAVSVHEPKTGSVDVQFRSSEIQSVDDMLLTNSGKEHPWHSGEQGMENLHNRLSGLQEYNTVAPKDPISLVVTPGGHVAFRNLETGNIEWVAEEVFESPVAFCVDSSTGASVGVDVVQDAVSPDGSPEYLFSQMVRQINLSNPSARTGSGQPLVGSMKSGQLFAMPLGVRPLLSETVEEEVFEEGSPITSLGTASSSSQAKEHHIAVPPLSVGPRPGLHNEKKGGVMDVKKPCHPGNANFPACLVGSTKSGDPFAVNGYFLPTADDDHGIVPHYNYDHYFRPPPMQGLSQLHGQQSWKYVKLLSSYLIPTILTIFVASFEMGRRKRQRDKDSQLSSDVKSNEASVGVIQLQDDVILGYGGHGTVVFKGTLEGRQVAVKRMLRTYHASADREISLLIESDGHANVVRYFLKEVRGDFVYLALELCDLSLHDLIGTLHDQMELQPKKALSAFALASTKTILSQIANGVSHLHRLRIVHRDLKPANILLADVKKAKRRSFPNEPTSVFSIFKGGEYVAKISDMGLGKQLMGQSSFGASGLGESSLRGHSNGGQSSNAGAGPGSVGWQAPEVMAKRISSDASVRSDNSGYAPSTDSIPDASPLDIAVSSRTSRSVDIFSLGCIFYSLLIPGSHPFGEWYEREANIMHNRPRIEPLLEVSSDAYDLVKSMIQRNPQNRPTAKQVCDHHFFWPAARRLAFLCDFSDRLETDAVASDDGTPPPSASILAVEKNAVDVVGTAWDSNLDDSLVSNVQRFRTYDPSSVRDLLRLIRNKHHHYDELPETLKEEIGSNTDGLMKYFDKHFPSLLLHCVSVCREILPPIDTMAAKYSISRVGKHIAETRRQAGTDQPTPKLLDESKESMESEVINGKGGDIHPSSPGLTTIVEGQLNERVDPNPQSSLPDITNELDVRGIIVWEGSAAANTLNCRGWSRSDDEWERCTDVSLRKRDSVLTRCAEDPKFRTRLCNHWDENKGSFCPMKKKGKCIFAHGPVELRVKEGKRGRWGRLVDPQGNNKNPNHSGGEDTYGAARSIETERRQEGKWNTKGRRGKPNKKPAA